MCEGCCSACVPHSSAFIAIFVLEAKTITLFDYARGLDQEGCCKPKEPRRALPILLDVSRLNA